MTMPFKRQLALLYLLLLSPVILAKLNGGDVAVPATPAVFVGDVGGELGFTPRYYAEGQALYRLGGRQVGTGQVDCSDPTKSHTCGELGALGEASCCPNERYCFFGGNWTVQCCSIGNKCSNVCDEGHFLINTTVTSTFEVTVGVISGTNTAPILTQSLSEKTVESGGCKPRKCAVSEFQCPMSLGGGCCKFGNPCLTGGSCGVPITASPTGFVPTANGCPSRNQFSCAASLGGNCCFNGQTCVLSGNTQACAGQATSPPGTEITYTGGGLSQGAKAGIGVGVAVGAALIIGILTWFCLRHRKAATAGRNTPYPSQHGYHSVGQGGQAGPAGAGATDVMSDVSGPSRGAGPHRTGLVYEYFGPAAVAGPYTQQDGETPHTPRGMWDRFAPSAPVRRAVPVAGPEGPGDIAPPVEMGDDAHLKASKVQAAKTTPEPSVAPALATSPEQRAEVFELWGSPGIDPLERSPLEEAGEQQRQQERRVRPDSHVSSYTEYHNSQEKPDPHSTAESGSTVAESAHGGNGHANRVSTVETVESIRDGQGHTTDSDKNNNNNSTIQP
ncbi:hypothetical protein PG996_000699 [Apiospora saccharicola]|uniref:Uncharacterized protein n=1 Tax=Apiospora saccharicola TaxID=335842 RepID=A0ABR1WIK8_9PEZI